MAARALIAGNHRPSGNGAANGRPVSVFFAGFRISSKNNFTLHTPPSVRIICLKQNFQMLIDNGLRLEVLLLKPAQIPKIATTSHPLNPKNCLRKSLIFGLFQPIPPY
jgi:hypothetical protein